MNWEVRTMRSGTSFFDLTIYRKTVNRFWPLWAVNLVIWLFILPFNGLVTLGDYIDGGRAGNTMLRFAQGVGDYATQWGVIFALLAGLVVAMAVCSHLYNSRSANFMGSLPCRREGQFFSTYLAGLTILIVPNLLIFLLTLLVEVAAGTVVWVSLLYWLAALCGMEFFFYSFAVCLGQFAGHILALPVFYAIFNAIVVAVYGLLGYVLDVYYFGFNGLSGVGESIVTWCTPVVPFLQMDIRFIEENGVPFVHVDGLWVVAVYAAVGVALAACALLLYRRRHLETAGDIVAVRVMRPVFKYGVAICTGLFFGFLMDQMFSLGEVGMMIAIVIWGIVGYFVAQMLLDKSIRVFKKWKGAAAVVVVFLLLFAVVAFDLTGFERRVPAAANVESVEISGLASYDTHDGGNSLSAVVLEDPEDIQSVIDLHQGIVQVGSEDGYLAADDANWVTFEVTYTLKSGTSMSRRYNMMMDGDLLALAQAVRDRYNVRVQAYRIDDIPEWETAGYRMESVDYRAYEQTSDATEATVGSPYAEKLWAAVMEDFEAGRIGIHKVGSADNKYSDPSEGVLLSFRWAQHLRGEKADEVRYRYVEFQVLPQSSATWQFLETEAFKVVDRDDPNNDPLEG